MNAWSMSERPFASSSSVTVSGGAMRKTPANCEKEKRSGSSVRAQTQNGKRSRRDVLRKG